MSVTETLYTARFELPELVERGRSQAIQCRVYRSGALAAPSSGTVSLYRAGGTAVIVDAAVTITGSVATYTVTAGTTTSLSLGDGWLVEWALLMPDGGTHTFRCDAALGRRRLYPVVTDADIVLRHKALDPSSSSAITSQSTYQDQLDAAWLDIQRRLIRQGSRPYLVMEPSSLYEAHLSLAVALVYEDLAARINEAYLQLSDRYRAQYEQAWAGLQFRYDRDDDGIADAAGARRKPVPVTMLCQPGRGRYWRAPWPS